MKEKEIKEELELCIRSFLDAEERSKQEGIDTFDELRILESAFNRLFMCMEHLCNAIILLEMGNFSKKHFGDFTKLKSLKEKYKSDLAETYQTTYNFRSYGDYRKFPEVKDKFNRGELKNKIAVVNVVIKNSFEIIGRDVDIKEITQKLFKTKKQKSANKRK